MGKWAICSNLSEGRRFDSTSPCTRSCTWCVAAHLRGEHLVDDSLQLLLALSIGDEFNLTVHFFSVILEFATCASLRFLFSLPISDSALLRTLLLIFNFLRSSIICCSCGVGKIKSINMCSRQRSKQMSLLCKAEVDWSPKIKISCNTYGTPSQ